MEWTQSARLRRWLLNLYFYLFVLILFGKEPNKTGLHFYFGREPNKTDFFYKTGLHCKLTSTHLESSTYMQHNPAVLKKWTLFIAGPHSGWGLQAPPQGRHRGVWPALLRGTALDNKSWNHVKKIMKFCQQMLVNFSSPEIGELQCCMWLDTHCMQLSPFFLSCWSNLI